MLLAGAALLLAGLGGPGLWEPWEMDRAWLATSLNAPPEAVVVTADVGDSPLGEPLDALVRDAGAVARRPEAAATPAVEGLADGRVRARAGVDMLRQRAVAGLVIDARLLSRSDPGGDDAATLGGLIGDALRQAAPAAVIVVAQPGEAVQVRASLAAAVDAADAAAREPAETRSDPSGAGAAAGEVVEGRAADTLGDASADAGLARSPAPLAAGLPRLVVVDGPSDAALGEALRAGVAALGGRVVLRQDGETRAFPPLDTWLRALSMQLLGASELAARLPGVLLALLSLAALMWAAAAVHGPRTAVIAGCVALTMPLFFGDARVLSGEPGDLLAVSLAGAALLRLSALGDDVPLRERASSLALFAISLLVALLAKGLYGLLLLTLLAAVEPAVRLARSPLAWAPAGVAALGSLVLALLLAGADPDDAVTQFGLGQALFSEGPTPYFRSFDLVIRNLGFGLAPWSPVVVLAIGLLTFDALGRQDRAGLIVAAWFFVPLVAVMATLKDFDQFHFSAAPAAALAVALFLERVASRGYRSAFGALALLFMFFILRNELKQSPEPLVAPFAWDPPFAKEGPSRFPEGLALGFAFKTTLALLAVFCVFHAGRLGELAPRAAAFLRRERPFAISLAVTLTLLAIAALAIAARPHGRAMGTSHLELLGPGQRDFVRAFTSLREPLMVAGPLGLGLLALLGVWRFRRERGLKAPRRYEALLARRPGLPALGWGLALGAWGLAALLGLVFAETPADFWGETLAGPLAWPALGLLIGAGVGLGRLTGLRVEGLLAAASLGAFALATRFIRDTGTGHPLFPALIALGTVGAVGAFALRVLPTVERFALGVALFLSVVLGAFTVALLDRWRHLAWVLAQGAPVDHPLALFKSAIFPVLLVVALLLLLNARGRPLLTRLRLPPERLAAAVGWLGRGPTLVGVLLLGGLAATLIQLFVFQPSFAINVSQKHIIDTWNASASASADEAAGDPLARILRHGSFGRPGARDTNFYTASFPELRDRNVALGVLHGARDHVVAVDTAHGTEYRHFSGFSPKNDGDGDGRTDAPVFSGFATGIARGRLEDKGAAWTPGALRGQTLLDANGQAWTIGDNDATSLTVADPQAWTFEARPRSRAFYAVSARPLAEPTATGAARERRALLIPAEQLSELNHAWRQLSGGSHLPILEGSSYRVLLATSWLRDGEPQQNRLANATYDDASFRALSRPNLRRVWGSFEDTIQVVGYDVDRTVIGGNDKLRLTVYYKARKLVKKSLKIFLHLDRLGATSRIHGDHWPLNPTRHSEENKNCTGCYRTDHWLPGDIVADTYDVEIPEGSSAGEYMIWLGLYQPGPDTRLKLTTWDQANCKHDGANRLGLGTVTVR